MVTLRAIGLWLLLGLVGLTAACSNTIHGVGEDAREADEAIHEAVE